MLQTLWLRLCARTLALKRASSDWPKVLAQQGCSLSQVPGLVSVSQDLSLAARSALLNRWSVAPTGGPEFNLVLGTGQNSVNVPPMWNKNPHQAKVFPSLEGFLGRCETQFFLKHFLHALFHFSLCLPPPPFFLFTFYGRTLLTSAKTKGPPRSSYATVLQTHPPHPMRSRYFRLQGV